jgi:hypothetical protein
MLAIIQEAVLLIGSILGGATDAKTGYIYDWITIPMMILGIILSLLQSQWNNLILGTTIFGLLYLTYKYGKIGGGDVKLFTAIALLNPTNNIYFLFTGLIVACGSAMVFYSTYFALKYFKTGFNFKENKKGIIKALIFGAILIVYFIILAKTNLLSLTTAILFTVVCFFGLIFIALQEGVKKNFFEKKIKLSEIEDDEVLCEERNSKKVMNLLKGKKLVGEKEKKILAINKVKEIIVLRGLPPFGPFIAIGVIIATINPEIIMLLFI